MSASCQEQKRKKSEGWDKAIADAKEKIKGLQFSIEVFEQNKREGKPWPGSGGYTVTQKAGTAGESIPA